MEIRSSYDCYDSYFPSIQPSKARQFKLNKNTFNGHQTISFAYSAIGLLYRSRSQVKTLWCGINIHHVWTENNLTQLQVTEHSSSRDIFLPQGLQHHVHVGISWCVYNFRLSDELLDQFYFRLCSLYSVYEIYKLYGLRRFVG